MEQVEMLARCYINLQTTNISTFDMCVKCAMLV